MANKLNKLLDRVTTLKGDLKEANASLKDEIESTSMYKAFFNAIKETQQDVPDKVAAGNAYKLTLSMLTKKEEGGDAE